MTNFSILDSENFRKALRDEPTLLKEQTPKLQPLELMKKLLILPACSFGMFDSLTFRVTLGKLQAYCLGHVRIEAYTLLQFLRFLSYIKKSLLFGGYFSELISWSKCMFRNERFSFECFFRSPVDFTSFYGEF